MFRPAPFFWCCLALVAPLAIAAEPGRDPTRPLNYGAARATVALTLNAVLHGGSRQVAVINGQRLREGDVIASSGGVRVARIDPAGVTVEGNGRRWRLTLNEQSVRQ